MKRLFKSILALTLFTASAAQAQEIRVKFSVVDWQSFAKIDWQSGWSTIHVYAVGPAGEIVNPADDSQEADTFVFPGSGRYTFHGQGAYVCGLNNGQELEITPNIVEIQLFGWCE
jgi:hypothetical protein